MNGISALVIDPKEIVYVFYHVRPQSWEVAVYKPERSSSPHSESAGFLILHFEGSRPVSVGCF